MHSTFRLKFELINQFLGRKYTRKVCDKLIIFCASIGSCAYNNVCCIVNKLYKVLNLKCVIYKETDMWELLLASVVIWALMLRIKSDCTFTTA